MSKRSGTGDSLNPTNPNKRTRQPEQTNSNIGEGLMQAAEGYMIGRIQQKRGELENRWKKRDAQAQKQIAFLEEQVCDREKTIRDWQERYAEAMKTITDLADKVDELKKGASKKRR